MAVISNLKTRSKNLWNKDDIYIPVIAGEYYQIQFYNNTNYKTISLYDTQKNLIKDIIKYSYAGETYNKWIIKPQQDGYLVAFINNGYMIPDYEESLMVTKGLTATLTAAQIESLNTNQYTRVDKNSTFPQYEPYYIDITKYNNATISNINFNDIDYHFAKQNEVIGGNCDNAVEEPIIDLKVSGNSVQDGTPTPETPIEIESVGEKTKNLFNNKFSDYVRPVNYLYTPIDLEVGKTYTISAKQVGETITGCVVGIAKYGTQYSEFYPVWWTCIRANGEIATHTFTVTEEFTDPKLLIYCTNEAQFNQLFENYQIQLEESDTATEYEPYGYKVPVKVSGKNLFNKETAEENYFINSSGKKASTESYGLKVTEKIYIKPLTTYTYSGMGNVRGVTVGRTGYQYDKDDNPITPIKQSYGEDVTFTTEPNCYYNTYGTAGK